MVQVQGVPGLTPPPGGGRAVIGWLVPAEERARLLDQFAPRYERVVADHVTYKAGVVEDAPPPPAPDTAEIVGVADDGKGVQALVVRLNGTTDRPDGSTWHITWSLGAARKARESNDVIRERGWTDLDAPVPVRLEPGRFNG